MLLLRWERWQRQLLLLLLVFRWGPWANSLLDALDFLYQLLELAALAHALVRFINNTAEVELAAALARLAGHGARIAFDL